MRRCAESSTSQWAVAFRDSTKNDARFALAGQPGVIKRVDAKDGTVLVASAERDLPQSRKAWFTRECLDRISPLSTHELAELLVASTARGLRSSGGDEGGDSDPNASPLVTVFPGADSKFDAERVAEVASDFLVGSTNGSPAATSLLAFPAAHIAGGDGDGEAEGESGEVALPRALEDLPGAAEVEGIGQAAEGIGQAAGSATCAEPTVSEAGSASPRLGELNEKEIEDRELPAHVSGGHPDCLQSQSRASERGGDSLVQPQFTSPSLNPPLSERDLSAEYKSGVQYPG